MTMDDQFLHRLRRDPPAGFATRLKWQLDRPVPARRFSSRLILGLVICGTAFALISAPGRHALSDWLATSTTPPQSASPAISHTGTPSAAGSAVVSRGAASPPPAGRPRNLSAVPSVPEPVSASASVPTDADDAHQAAATRFAPVAIVPGALQTAEMQAAQAVTLRQGLFRTLGFVMGPLGLMQRGAPVDQGVVRTSATRLQTLSSLIPEVFRQDTRPFAVNTRAEDGIWANYPDFQSKADDLTLAADALAAAAATSDDIAVHRAIGRIEVACTACHDLYRRKPAN